MSIIKKTKIRTNTGFRGVIKRNKKGASNYEAYVFIKGVRVFFKGTKTLPEAVAARTNFITNLL